MTNSSMWLCWSVAATAVLQSLGASQHPRCPATITACSHLAPPVAPACPSTISPPPASHVLQLLAPRPHPTGATTTSTSTLPATLPATSTDYATVTLRRQPACPAARLPRQHARHQPVPRQPHDTWHEAKQPGSQPPEARGPQVGGPGRGQHAACQAQYRHVKHLRQAGAEEQGECQPAGCVRDLSLGRRSEADLGWRNHTACWVPPPCTCDPPSA